MKVIQIFLAISIMLAYLCCGMTDDFTQAKAAQEPEDERGKAAADELYQGACAYTAGNYAEAQRRFEKALAINPDDNRLPLFLARSLHAQAIKGTASVNDVERAKAAIAAYEKVLAKNAEDAEALDAILRLYRRLEQDEQAREWLRKRATSEALSPEQRTHMFNLLANRFRSAYDKIIRGVGGGPSNPASANDLVRARQYVRQGLEAIERALQISPDHETDWLIKSMLLKAKAEIAEMENKGEEKALALKAAEEAEAKYKKAMAEEKKAMAEAMNKPLANTETNTDKPDSQISEPDKIFESVVAVGDFRSSGGFKRGGDPGALIDPVEPNIALAVLIEERKKVEEERRAKSMAKLPWKLFSPVGEGFSVWMPSPVEQKLFRDSSYYTVQAEGVSYIILLRPLIKAKEIEPPNEMIVSSTAAGAAHSICNWASSAGENCEVALMKDLSIPGGASRQYRIKSTKCGESKPGVMQVYVSQKRVYVLIARGADEADARVTKFLQSFTLRNTAKTR
jgi:tetratricopeptide (TPR) repeat protein